MQNPTSAAVLSAALALAACAAPRSAPLPAADAAATAAAPAPAAAAGDPLRRGAETITPADIHARIEFLSHDRFRGRNTPSPELDLAAAYLVNQYRLWGLRPGGEGGTFYQWYPYPLRKLDVDRAALSFAGPRGTLTLARGNDFYVAGSTTGTVTGAPVFVGGAPASLTGAGSLQGRVAVSIIPGPFNRDFRIERNRQVTAAQRAGAVALVYVLDPVWSADSIGRYQANAEQASRSLGGGAFPQFFVTAEAAGRLFRSAGLELAEMRARAARPDFRPVPLEGVTATVSTPQMVVDDARAPNVVAILPGSDPALADEYVVVSAHMDHVGVGAPDATGDSIYNGADDDASGTSGLLEVAQAFVESGVRPRRSIVFLHVSGEEKGLIGSAWYADHPTLPLAKIAANVNVDMIARNAPDSVVAIGKDYSSLGPLVERIGRAHPELGLTVADDQWPGERIFFRSDHFNFAKKEVPAIFFFTGLHPDYHRPSDEIERIDADKAARIARLIYYTAYEIANDPQRPQWVPEGLEQVRRMVR
jgi:hypothetical protein